MKGDAITCYPAAMQQAIRPPVMEIYRQSRRALGPRGWWPAFRAGAGPNERPVYDPRRKRLTEGQRFEIAVGAILTQNTAWTNVEKALVELHRREKLSSEGIHRLPRARLGQIIRSSGYFNQKSIKLKAFIRYLRGRRMSELGQKDTAVLRESLLGVKGIGPETADSILLYALEKPVFVVDAYTRRIFSRHGWITGDEPYDDIRKWFETNLQRSVKLFNDYHAQIVEIGKRYCHRREPECRSCPLFRRKFFVSEGRFENPTS